MRRFGSIAVLVFAVALCLGVGPARAQSGTPIEDVVVEGTQRIEEDTVRSYVDVRRGEPFDRVLVDRTLKKLFATGLFADVQIIQRGGTLVVKVVENPVINRIAFEGNKRIKTENLQQEVTLKPRVIYTRTRVQNDVQRILTLYRRSGRFAATVEPKVIRLEQNRVDLVFEINEGPVTEIERIRFIGNRAFSDSRLREEIRTRETRWWRFFSSDDNYDPDRLTLDRELLRRFYLKKGFADFRVVSAVAELTPDREDFFITFAIEEGERYRFGKVEVEARLRGLSPEDVQDVVAMEEGDWYDADLLEKTIDKLTDEAGNRGFAFVDVRPRINRNRETKTIDVAYEINEGPRVYVERINIAGNVRTQDKVIRREFRLVEGDAFNASKLRRSKQRIRNLGFFEKVDVAQVPGSAPDKTVIDVEVAEKSTGSLSVGVGFSTANGAMLDLGIREKNLLGKGQDLKLNAMLAQRRSQVDLGFTEPYFLDREIAAGGDIFYVATDLQDTSSHDTRTAGFALRAGYPITEALSQSWKYTFKSSEITRVKDNASVYIKAAEGTHTVSEVSHTIAYDQRDSKINPTDGYIVRLTTDAAGAGGNAHYLRNRLRGATYFPLADQWVLSLNGSVGYIFGLGEDVSLLDRFFLGGDDLRGFATRGVGPRDLTTKDALGGELIYTASAEVTFPLGLPNEFGITGRFFTDIGSLSSLHPSSPDIADTGSMRLSMGAGLGWNSPFGPIGVDFGFPILKEGFDKEENIRVNFGTRF